MTSEKLQFVVGFIERLLLRVSDKLKFIGPGKYLTS